LTGEGWGEDGEDFRTKEIFLEKLKKRIQQIKKKRPGYGEILDFYQKVKEAQEDVKTSLNIHPIKLKKEWKELLTKEGFSLIEKKDFPLDREVSIKLFQALCRIGEKSNPHMAEQVKKIEEAIDHKRIDLTKLFKGEGTEPAIARMADEFGLDKKIFSFLVQSAIKPSVEAGEEQLRSAIDSEAWFKGYCPICGSLPFLSLLKEDVGKRYLLCSYCGHQWRIDRLFCPFCNNKEQASLHYFQGEGEEAYRIDLCDNCHQHIKTIDDGKLAGPDPVLEDIATLHLDILASQKGYKRPVPSPWTT
jgi:FdhE protein